MTEALLKIIGENKDLSIQEVQNINDAFQYLKVTKNTLIETEGSTPEYLYFIVSGCIRLFYLNETGSEVTTFLGSENDFITSFLSFIHQEKSAESMAAITDCEVLRIKHPVMKALIDKSEGFKAFSVTIFEHAIATTNQRANDFATLNAEKRYAKLVENKPHLIQNVPLQYLASYLGVQPESLSRIRRNFVS